MKKPLLLAIFLYTSILFSQNFFFSTFTIPKELQENANACLRLNDVELTVDSRKQLTTKTHRVVTVFNKLGDRHLENYEFYDAVTKIKELEVFVYDAVGNVTKKFKKKDFSDTSVADGAGSISDTRRLILDYTPTQYPYTLEFKSVVETDNTAFLPNWYPLDDYFLSVESNRFSISHIAELGLRYKESNFDFFPIDKKESSEILVYEAKNISAIKREDYSPSFKKFLPNVMFSLSKFHLEGVNGEADSWESFGKWMYDALLVDTDELPEETVQKIRDLVAGVSDPIEKTKLVFQFVQDKTRYVSIQLGIGGWKPMKVKDVDRLGYGDCKALTNYTRALLKAVGIPSYYAIIYLDRNIRDLDADFVSIQGNHATLAIPFGDQLCWAECTSQTVPFNLQALSTDDRNALLVSEEGGRIVKTNVYNPEKNEQITKGSCQLSETGNINFSIARTSKGTQYVFKSYLDTETDIEKKNHYKNEFSYINGLNVSSLAINNNKENIVFDENVSLTAEKFAQITGDRILLPINITNRNSKIPTKYRNRIAPFEISRGYYDEDEIEFQFPEGYVIEAKSEDVNIDTKFGVYKATYKLTDKGMIYKRSYLLKSGLFSKEEYEEFRKFVEQVVTNDQAKIVLKKSI
uniref:DUF3857 domain-containing protein n=1 Tax=Flavobacterium sp. TaxID=239 RepID=UPI0040490CDD